MAKQNTKKAPAGNGPARYILVLFQAGRGELGNISRTLLRSVQEQADARITTEPNKTEIDVWLESGGGDANAAYKLILDLRSRCVRLRTIIPDYAKSAATLIALGTDVIYMAEAAELGPLDMQIEHPDREGFTVSALDVADALDWMAKFAVDYTVEGGVSIINWTSLPRVQVLREMLEFSASLLAPVVGKLDPLLIHKAANELGVAKRYASELLKGRRLQEGDENVEVDVAKIVHDLVSSYPAHDFCISRHAAAALGLPVRLANKYSKWLLAKELHRRFEGGLRSGEGPPFMVQLLAAKELIDRDEGANTNDSDEQEPQEGAYDGNGSQGSQQNLEARD